MSTIDFATLGQTKLAPVINGAIAGGNINAEFLWSQGPCAFFVIRRPGCELCREDAKEVATRFATGEFEGIHLFGIIKEVAPIVGATTDEELGVGEFQFEYFNQNPVFIDKEKQFYAYLGNKSVMSQKWLTWNPFRLYSAYSALKARLLGKNIKGNLKGEGLLKGGFLIIHPTKGVVYRHEESTGDGLPYDELVAALRAVVNPPAERTSIFSFGQTKSPASPTTPVSEPPSTSTAASPTPKKCSTDTCGLP